MRLPSASRSISVVWDEATGVNMTKRFYIEVTCVPFGGKLTIDVDADCEKQAWDRVNDIMSRRICQLKTVDIDYGIHHRPGERDEDD